jgi:hypothetical protein
MNELLTLTPTDERAVMAAGAAWCSEETFARIFAMLNATREELRLMTAKCGADAQIVALFERLLPADPSIIDSPSMTSLSIERGKSRGWLVQGVVGNYDLATGKGKTLREALLALRTRVEETK